MEFYILHENLEKITSELFRNKFVTHFPRTVGYYISILHDMAFQCGFQYCTSLCYISNEILFNFIFLVNWL